MKGERPDRHDPAPMYLRPTAMRSMKTAPTLVRTAALLGCGSVANILVSPPLLAQVAVPAASAERQFIEQPIAVAAPSPVAASRQYPAVSNNATQTARGTTVQAQTVGYVADPRDGRATTPVSVASARQTVTNPHAAAISPPSKSTSVSATAASAVNTFSPTLADPPRGWGAVGDELVERLTRCDTLLRHGAIHSARDEATIGLRTLARAIDIRLARVESEAALAAGLTALEEQQAFYAVQANPSAQPNIAAGHRTAVQINADGLRTPPLIAAGLYRRWAREQFVAAAAGHPWAADYLYALGRTYEAEAEIDPLQASMHREIAACCYQAAIQVRSDHTEAANQLGFVLLRLDRLAEAEAALVAAASQTPDALVYQNLAELHRRRGDEYASRQAASQAAKLAGSTGGGDAKVPEVTELTPQQFARYSPNLLDGSPAVNRPQQVASASAATAPVGQPSAATPHDTATKKTSPPLQAVGEMFGRILR